MNANTKIGYGSNFNQAAEWICSVMGGDVYECRNWLYDGSLEDKPTLKTLARLWTEEGKTYNAG